MYLLSDWNDKWFGIKSVNVLEVEFLDDCLCEEARKPFYMRQAGDTYFLHGATWSEDLGMRSRQQYTIYRCNIGHLSGPTGFYTLVNEFPKFFPEQDRGGLGAYFLAPFWSFWIRWEDWCLFRGTPLNKKCINFRIFLKFFASLLKFWGVWYMGRLAPYFGRIFPEQGIKKILKIIFFAGLLRCFKWRKVVS